MTASDWSLTKSVKSTGRTLDEMIQLDLVKLLDTYDEMKRLFNADMISKADFEEGIETLIPKIQELKGLIIK